MKIINAKDATTEKEKIIVEFKDFLLSSMFIFFDTNKDKLKYERIEFIMLSTLGSLQIFTATRIASDLTLEGKEKLKEQTNRFVQALFAEIDKA